MNTNKKQDDFFEEKESSFMDYIKGIEAEVSTLERLLSDLTHCYSVIDSSMAKVFKPFDGKLKSSDMIDRLAVIENSVSWECNQLCLLYEYFYRDFCDPADERKILSCLVSSEDKEADPKKKQSASETFVVEEKEFYCWDILTRCVASCRALRECSCNIHSIFCVTATPICQGKEESPCRSPIDNLLNLLRLVFINLSVARISLETSCSLFHAKIGIVEQPELEKDKEGKSASVPVSLAETDAKRVDFVNHDSYCSGIGANDAAASVCERKG